MAGSAFFLVPIVAVEPRRCHAEGCTHIATQSVISSKGLADLGSYCDEHAEEGLRRAAARVDAPHV